MGIYSYRAISNNGEVVIGEIDAKDEPSVVDRLHEMDYLPIKVEKKTFKKRGFGIFKKKMGNREILSFTQELATLLEAGLPLDNSLSVLLDLHKEIRFKELIEDIKKDIEGGNSLSESMGKHPRIFPKLYINMIRAGEEGGILEMVLKRLTQFLEDSQKLRDEIISAMIYPLILTFVGGAAIIFLLLFVIPRFSGIFEEMGGNIPLPTQILLDIATGIKMYWWIIISGIILTIIYFKTYINSPNGRFKWDQWKLNTSIMGDLIRKIEVSRFCRTLGTLLKSGVQLLQSLRIGKEVINNRVIANGIDRVISGAKEGEGIASPLKEADIFPPLAIHMIGIGEESGKLDDMLVQIAEVYDNDIRNSMKRIISFLEPAMILFMAFVVGFIVISMLLAIFSINEIPL